VTVVTPGVSSPSGGRDATIVNGQLQQNTRGLRRSRRGEGRTQGRGHTGNSNSRATSPSLCTVSSEKSGTHQILPTPRIYDAPNVKARGDTEDLEQEKESHYNQVGSAMSGER
jgi:hypothetical protein